MTQGRIAVAMPLEGPPETAKCHFAVQLALRRLRGDIVLMDDERFGFAGAINGNVDVSRARDRFARVFLHAEPFRSCTHLLWWDEDVLPEDLHVIIRLLEAGHDVVGVPYRRKMPVENYPYRLRGEDDGRARVDVVNGCVEVDSLAFGFMLTSRAALTRMWNAYRDSRWYFDVMDNAGHETVGMFDLAYSSLETQPDGTPFRVKLSEDYSFCQAWRAIGGKVMMYVGPGSPATHLGAYAFKGTPEGLVRSA